MVGMLNFCQKIYLPTEGPKNIYLKQKKSTNRANIFSGGREGIFILICYMCAYLADTQIFKNVIL